MDLLDSTRSNPKIGDPRENLRIKILYSTVDFSIISDRKTFAIKTLDPEGFDSEWAYDNFGRIIATTDASGGVEARSYDVWGNLASVTDKNGNVTSYEYDALNRKVRSVDALGHEEIWQYDGNNNITRYTDKNGALTVFEYNALNQNTRVGGDASAPGGSSCGCTGGTSANGKEGRYEYDWKGNITKYTDPEGLVTVYEYDNMYRKIAEIKDSTGLNIQVRWEYDLLGRKVKETRVDNSLVEKHQITTFVYDKASRMVEARRWLDDENYLATKYSYDKLNHIVGMIDENGNLSTREYDAAYRLIRTTDREGLVVENIYNARGDMVQQVVDPEGLNIVTSNEFDGNRRLVKTLEPDGGISSRTFDHNGNMLSSTDAFGQVTSYEYDAMSRMIRTVDTMGHATTFQLDGLGNRVKVVDANCTITKTFYDLKSFVEKTIEDVGGIERTTHYERDKLMHPVTSIDAFNTVALTEYDKIYRPILRIADATGKNVVSETVYNSLNQVVKTIDAGGFETKYEYDNLGRRTRELLPDGGEVSYIFDNNSNVVEKIQKVSSTGQVLVTRYAYDKENRLIETIEDAEGMAIKTTRAYDILGRLASLTDAQGAVTSYEYDSENRIVKETYADGGEIHMSYDLKGRLVERRDQNNAVTNYFYDTRDLLVRKTYGTGGEQTFEYDSLRRLVRDTDNNNSLQMVSVTYIYDALHRQLSSTQSVGSGPAQTLCKVFDVFGHEIECHHPSGRIVRKTYTALHQVDKIFTSSGNGELLVTDYTYEYEDGDSDKRMVVIGQDFAPSTGVKLSVAVDEMSRTTSRVYQQAGAPLVGFEHSYNLQGNRTRDTHLHNPTDSETYNYDTAQRFSEYERDGGLTQSWNLDKLGNWKQFDNNGQLETRTHNNVNEVLSVSPDKNLAYDDNGNMTFYANKNFVWDANNRLTHVYSTTVPGQITRYYYTAMNNRVKKTVDTDGNGLLDDSTVYIYCGQQVCEEQNENGGFKRDYVHGGQFIDEVVMTSDAPSGLGRFSLTDLRYSVYAVVDSNGVVVERYQYDPYGKRTVMNAGYGVLAKSVIGQEFGYTGRQHDSEDAGLMYFRARMYSCDLGRFVGRDPLGTALDINRMIKGNIFNAGVNYIEGMSLYRAYFSVNGLDPSGQVSWQQFPDLPLVPPSIPPNPAGTSGSNPCNDYPEPTRCCGENGMEDDTYPTNAENVCNGFLSMYSYSQAAYDAASCVARCLATAEQANQRISSCSTRDVERLSDHMGCYISCGFTSFILERLSDGHNPFPDGSWDVGVGDLIPGFWDAFTEIFE